MSFFSLLSFILRPLFGNPPFFEQIGINQNFGSNQATFANQILSNNSNSNENFSTEAAENNDGNRENNFDRDRRKTRRRENRQRFKFMRANFNVFSILICRQLDYRQSAWFSMILVLSSLIFKIFEKDLEGEGSLSTLSSMGRPHLLDLKR